MDKEEHNMGKIADFACTYENAIGIGEEITSGLGLAFPDAYQKAELMVKLAKAGKAHNKGVFCELPFCHTLEADAMGASINMGDETSVPRAGEYLYKKMEEMKGLPEIDFTKGRMAETLKACQMLRDEGEHVAIEITGPFAFMNVFMDVKYIFKALRKEKDAFFEVCDHLGRQLIRLIWEAQEHGVEVISYADGAGGVNILGEEMAAEVAQRFTRGFVEEAVGHIGDKALLLLCPKTSFALIGTDLAEWRDVPLTGPMTYGEACLEMIGKVKLGGQMCLKNIDYTLSAGTFKELVLK